MYKLNWLCKYIKKVRGSQAAILAMNWVKHRFSWSIVNVVVLQFQSWSQKKLHLKNKGTQKTFAAS